MLMAEKDFHQFWASKNGGLYMEMTVIPKQLMQNFCKSPWIKTESLHVNHNDWFKIHCENCVFVQQTAFMYFSIYTHIYRCACM